MNEQARMTIGSQEYIAHARRIRDLRGILAEHNRQIAATSRSWSLASLGDAFNRYFSLVTAFAATVIGLVLAFKTLVKTFKDYEEPVDNLSALTGLAGDNLEWLSEKAKQLSTSTLESGIRVTQSAQEIVDAFTKTGSARPELLKNEEALSQVTQEAIILSNASKTTLQPAIKALTMEMNQYNVSATEARRIINALGAGSKEGAETKTYWHRINWHNFDRNTWHNFDRIKNLLTRINWHNFDQNVWYNLNRMGGTTSPTQQSTCNIH